MVERGGDSGADALDQSACARPERILPRRDGYVLTRGAAQVTTSDTVAVVLDKVAGSCSQFIVKTAYPK